MYIFIFFHRPSQLKKKVSYRPLHGPKILFIFFPHPLPPTTEKMCLSNYGTKIRFQNFAHTHPLEGRVYFSTLRTKIHLQYFYIPDPLINQYL